MISPMSDIYPRAWVACQTAMLRGIVRALQLHCSKPTNRADILRYQHWNVGLLYWQPDDHLWLYGMPSAYSLLG